MVHTVKGVHIFTSVIDDFTVEFGTELHTKC